MRLRRDLVELSQMKFKGYLDRGWNFPGKTSPRSPNAATLIRQHATYHCFCCFPPPSIPKGQGEWLTLAHPTSSCILFYSMDIYPSNAGGGVVEELPQTCLDFMDGTDPLLDMYKEWDLWDSSSRMTAWQVKVWHGSLGVKASMSHWMGLLVVMDQGSFSSNSILSFSFSFFLSEMLIFCYEEFSVEKHVIMHTRIGIHTLCSSSLISESKNHRIWFNRQVQNIPLVEYTPWIGKLIALAILAHLLANSN